MIILQRLLLFAMCLASPQLWAQVFYGGLLDAVQITLENQQAITASQQQINAADGQVLSQQGAFDTIVATGISHDQSYTLAPASLYNGFSEINSSQESYNLGVSKRLASGLVINPEMSVYRITDNYINQDSPSNLNVSVNFTLPLLKGLGSAVNLAPISSARLAREAAASNYSHTLSASIAQTVFSYWDCLGAKKLLDIAELAEARAQDLANDARALADADEIPVADILKFEVTLLNHKSATLAALQALVSAQGTLFKAMNMSARLPDALPELEADFPTPRQANMDWLNDADNIAFLIEGAQGRRFDIKAAEYIFKSADTLAKAARTDNKSRLDLTLSIGYNGLATGEPFSQSYLAFNNLASGANVVARLNYTVPASRSANRGEVLQKSSAAEEAGIRLQALKNNVNTDARVQFDNLQTAMVILDQALEQFNLQTQVYENEKRKYFSGISNLIDLLNSEDLLTRYQGELVLAQRNYAQALILLRHNTGTLLAHQQNSQTITRVQLITLPEISLFTDNSL